MRDLHLTSTQACSQASLLAEAKAFHTKKKLGQHFLVSPEKLNAIVQAVAPGPEDLVVEIGAGIGFLTRLLTDSGARVIAIDLDRQSIARLEQLSLPNLSLHHGDFLQYNLPTHGKIKVVGNVPYQITGLIIGHLLGELTEPSPWLTNIESIVLTVQREVAARMVALPGHKDYSRLSLLINCYCKASLETQIASNCFWPPPAVTSAVVKLVPLPSPSVTTTAPHLMRQLIAAGFRQRRKMLRNSLSFLHLTGNDLSDVFRELKI